MIEFRLSDWRTNCSILGLIKILEYNDIDYILNEKSIEIEEKVLEGFEESYFNYFSGKYEKDLPWYKIVSFKEKITEISEKFPNIEKEDLELLNNNIDYTKEYLKRNNYTKVYYLIGNGESLEEKVLELKKINLKKSEQIKDKVVDIEIQMDNLKNIIDIINTETAKKHIRAKGVIYTYINRCIDGISFLNRNTKFKDVFEDYKEYFITPLIKEIQTKKDYKNPYQCYSCGMDIGNLSSSTNINLLKYTGFDDAKKSSYIWNHLSDIIICQKCKFLYSMISAGFSFSPYEGLFINYSRNISGLKSVNKDAETRVENILKGDNDRGVSYRTILSSISRQNIDDLEYEKREIQIIRHKDEKYYFNILSREVISVLENSVKYLKNIETCFYKDNKIYVSIYDLVIDMIFEGRNLFRLIDFLLTHKISKNSSITGYFDFYHISLLGNINYEILKGGLDMGGLDMKSQIYFSKNDGNKLREEYIKSGNGSKIPGISYRILNALKTKNSEAYMNNIINAYMYLRLEVPSNMIIALQGEEELGLIGYAFVTGLNSKLNMDENEGDDSNEK